jgi:hypothetical protein
MACKKFIRDGISKFSGRQRTDSNGKKYENGCLQEDIITYTEQLSQNFDYSTGEVASIFFSTTFSSVFPFFPSFSEASPFS